MRDISLKLHAIYLTTKFLFFLVKEYKNVKSALEEMKEKVFFSFSSNDKRPEKLVGVF